MSDQGRTYATALDLPTGSANLHLTLTDDEMVAWVRENVDAPLVVELLALMDRHGAQQVTIALGVASCIDMWRRDHPEGWPAGKGATG